MVKNLKAALNPIEYLVAENQILRAHGPALLRLSNEERATLAEIGKRLGRAACGWRWALRQRCHSKLGTQAQCADVHHPCASAAATPPVTWFALSLMLFGSIATLVLKRKLER